MHNHAARRVENAVIERIAQRVILPNLAPPPQRFARQLPAALAVIIGHLLYIRLGRRFRFEIIAGKKMVQHEIVHHHNPGHPQHHLVNVTMGRGVAHMIDGGVVAEQRLAQVRAASEIDDSGGRQRLACDRPIGPDIHLSEPIQLGQQFAAVIGDAGALRRQRAEVSNSHDSSLLTTLSQLSFRLAIVSKPRSPILAASLRLANSRSILSAIAAGSALRMNPLSSPCTNSVGPPLSSSVNTGFLAWNASRVTYP